ncbi:MAG: saccharopine dehydrogenase NADP-binding domain-containing protein, partial [Thermoplasmata archaeon]|nr:saccharopine dehydrogenase NADP-binding domain-containing protein [Thermoplasmata archaeon]
MKVVQLGCGTCGLVCAEHLAKNPKVENLVLADIKPEAAEELASRLKRKNVSVKKVNGIDPKVLKNLLKDADIVVATMPWRMNRIVLDVAAQTGTD